MKNYKQFEVGKLLCGAGCRVGLTSDNDAICNHLDNDQVMKLAEELATHEQRNTEPTTLFEQVELYVDDPAFWFYVIQHDKRLQRHAKPWLVKKFTETSKRHLLRLSGQALSTPMKRHFKQLLLSVNRLTQDKDDLVYMVSNQQRRAAYAQF